MIKPNWDIFRTKFSENPQNNFEWFCYLLFCKEFNKPYGIFRYKNQSSIETNPIEAGNNVIGWQAKFYDTPLSEHKEKLLSAIENSKRSYPNITKLLFYTNQEWGQNKGQKPQGLIEIEEKAKELKIILDWRTASFFESEFVSKENEIFAKHFFTLDKSIFCLIEEQQKHTQNILNEIQTCIFFNNTNIEINRENCLEKLKDKNIPISIVSGVAGVGKTALIKKLYEHVKDKLSFFVFKATEFELRNINDLFKNFSFYDFIEPYREEENKIVIIDSSEKLLDLKNTDPFKEFLSALIKDEWRIIFTTRNNYLEQLNYQFFEIYHIAPLNISINNLELEELRSISDEYLFSLPKDEKLLELIRNPFYLNEYLRFYSDNEDLKYSDFKNKLWNKNIGKSKPERERCFLQLAFERANSGQFFVIPNCDLNILNELTRDGILGYELAGYFITHDIYEEWALEKIIEIEFIKKSNNKEFFENMGQSFPIRRCFRNWLSEKLLLDNEDIKQFIEEVIECKEVEPYWKDEILASVLISNYSETFFEIFNDDLLSDEQKLLKRLTFILRIVCKEIDYDFFKQLGLKNLDLFFLKYILTKPMGKGWESLIEFVFNNIEVIGIKNINFILPVIYDWNNKITEGKTTRFSSLIALQYYEWIISEDVYFSRDETEDHLFQTILHGSLEIKVELKDIFEQILKHKWKYHRDPYYDLSKFILTKFDGISVCKVFPEYVLRLADLFWTFTPKKGTSFYHSYNIEVEQYFGLEEYYYDYHPASAFQTPVYWLLQISFKKTIDFILDFTNKSISNYVKSGFDPSVIEVEVHLDNENNIRQYISNCLWNMYRGTGSPVSPYLLQSIHMALEKYLLEVGEKTDSKALESWLLYLLKNSESASITSIVTSIVLAYPKKTFNVAIVLFKTKEFILNETSRLILDQSAKSLYSFGHGLNYRDDIYADERIKTCEDKHRKWTLENLFLYYQCFKNEETSQEEAENRQKILWQILDNYYQLLANSNEIEKDKTWRLFLARMDRRKMQIATEQTDNGIEIRFNPEIEPELKQYSEESIAKSSESMKYTSLKLWANLKFRNNEEYKEYEKYENNPLVALQEVKDIVNKLNKIKAPKRFKKQHSEKESFFLFNHSIPAYVCSVLIENNLNELSQKDKSFCKDVILEAASYSLNPNYQYQISDGVEPSISSLSTLLEVFPEEKGKIKIILLLTLFNEYPVGGLVSNESFSIFSIYAIYKLWEKNFSDAQSLLFGYLLLRPRYNELRKKIREENFKKGIYESQENQWVERFFNENEKNINAIINNELELSDLKSIDKLDLRTLKTAFQIIPQKTGNEDHKKIIKLIISVFAKKILSDDRDEKIDYIVKHKFLEKYSYFVLQSYEEEIIDYLKPFLDNFNASESIADLFREFILAENTLNTYDNFWLIWNTFKDKVVDICKNGDGYWYADKIVKSYLFAQIPWKETIKEWHSLKDNNKRFFKEISDKIGHCPSALYAIAKLLNDIGSPFIDDGVIWVSIILDNNKNYVNKKLETNTIYYIENLIRKYTYKNREKIKRTKALRDKAMIILNFLVEKGSTIGYILRENII